MASLSGYEKSVKLFVDKEGQIAEGQSESEE